MDVFLEYLRAFVCGGILCAIGQILIDRTPLTPAKILVLYVVSGVVLGGLGLYKYVVEWGGAGATVPLTGFGYLLAKGVAQAVAENGFLGPQAASPPPFSSVTWWLSSSSPGPRAEAETRLCAKHRGVFPIYLPR